MKWKGKLINSIIKALRDDSEWDFIIEKLLTDITTGVHLAILNEPFLSLIYENGKQWESRFSINKISPFEKIRKGDIVILKESGGNVTGLFIAGNVLFYNSLNRNKLSDIKVAFGTKLGTEHDKDFWIKRERANYATLIEIEKLKKIEPFKIDKKSRNGWVIIRPGILNSFFNDVK